MTPHYLDLQLNQNADFSANVALTDISYNPIDLSNCIVISQIKKSFIAANVSATFAVSTINPLSGIITLSLDSANTAILFPTRYLYDVVIKNLSSNNVTRVLEGTIFVNPGISIIS